MLYKPQEGVQAGPQMDCIPLSEAVLLLMLSLGPVTNVNTARSLLANLQQMD